MVLGLNVWFSETPVIGIKTFTLCGTFVKHSHIIYKNGSLKNHTLKGCLGNQKWFFRGITAKNPVGKTLFL